MMRVILTLMLGIVAGLIPSRPLASTSGDIFDKIWLETVDETDTKTRTRSAMAKGPKKMAKTASLYILNSKIRVYFQVKTLAKEALATKKTTKTG